MDTRSWNRHLVTPHGRRRQGVRRVLPPPGMAPPRPHALARAAGDCQPQGLLHPRGPHRRNPERSRPPALQAGLQGRREDALTSRRMASRLSRTAGFQPARSPVARTSSPWLCPADRPVGSTFGACRRTLRCPVLQAANQSGPLHCRWNPGWVAIRRGKTTRLARPGRRSGPDTSPTNDVGS